MITTPVKSRVAIAGVKEYEADRFTVEILRRAGYFREALMRWISRFATLSCPTSPKRPAISVNHRIERGEVTLEVNYHLKEGEFEADCEYCDARYARRRKDRR